MKILVADDSSTVRRVVSARLSADGHEVVEAEDGEQAPTLARELKPALIVLDKVMPKLDGLEVVRALREDPQTKGLMIVMLTDRGGEGDVLDGFGLGVDEYMPKPFSPRELSMRIDRALARRGDG